MSYQKYQNRIKRQILVQNILIVLCIAGIAFFLYMRFVPKVHLVKADDECGPMGAQGMISHTIGSEDVCANICRTQYCTESKYRGSKFAESQNEGCNTCDCYCSA